MLSKGGVNCLRLTTQIGFSTSNDNFLLRIDCPNLPCDKVCYFGFQNRLLIISPSNLARVSSFLNLSLLFPQHFDQCFRRHVFVVGFPFNEIFDKGLSQSCCPLFCYIVLFPRNLEFVDASYSGYIVPRVFPKLDGQSFDCVLTREHPCLNSKNAVPIINPISVHLNSWRP